MPAKAHYLNELEIIQYCKKHDIDPSICYCKECGKFLAYDNAVFHINQVTHKLVCEDNKLTFLSVRNYNGNEYHLARCYDCVCEKFPNFKNVRFKFAHKAAKYTQYGFDVPDEDFNPVSTARLSVTKEKMIKKYGDEEGLFRWNSYCEKQALTNLFEYKHEKYGMTKELFDTYNQSRAVTLENMIKRHGEVKGHVYGMNIVKDKDIHVPKNILLRNTEKLTDLKNIISLMNCGRLLISYAHLKVIHEFLKSYLIL